MANPRPKRNKKDEFQPGNTAALKHGGEGALVRLRTGEPFIGLAREVLDGVLADLGVNLDVLTGIEGVLVRRAARFEAAARMFDHAADAAACEGNLDRWEKFQQRSGWIGGRAFGALGDVKEMLKKRQESTLDYEAVLLRGSDQ